MWRINDVPIFEHSWQTRRGTDWQSEHKKQAQQQDSVHDMVYLLEEIQHQHWQRKLPNIHVRSVNIVKLLVNLLVFRNVQSAIINSLAGLGSLSQEHLMQIAES